MSTAHSGQFVARYAVSRLVLLLLGGVALIAVSGLLVARGTGFQPLLGGLGAAFFGLCTIAVFTRLFDRRDILVIDGRGFLDRRLCSNVIPWNDVVSLREWSFRGQSMLLLKLRVRPKASSQTFFQRLIMGANRGFTRSDFHIPGDDLAGGYKAVKDAVIRNAPPQLTQGLR